MKENTENYENLQCFINTVFKKNKDDYFSLIFPALHKKKYNPSQYTTVIKDNDEYIACGSLIKFEQFNLDSNLKFGAIGNIATSKKFEGKGYMKQIMNEIIKDGNDCDILCLVGERIRYNRYNFDSLGVTHQFVLYKKNVISQIKAKYSLIIRESTENELSELYKLYTKQLIRSNRAEESFFDKLHSWKSSVFSIYNSDELVGYYCISDNVVYELVLEEKYLTSLLPVIFTEDYITFSIADYNTNLKNILYKYNAEHQITNQVRFLINNFKETVQSYLSLKLFYNNLPNVDLSFKIHGINCVEEFRLEILNNNLSFSNPVNIDYELSYNEALNFFFGLIDNNRSSNPSLNIFPLPLHVNHLDII